MKLTLKTVADAAGVSVATVDRVLNRRDGVRSRTIEKVEGAIRRLGYSPSSLASRLHPAPNRFAFMLPTGNNPFYSQLSDHIGRLSEWLPFAGSTYDIRRVDVFDGMALAEAIVAVAAEGYAGVAVAALDHPAVREAINTVRNDGIAVATLVSDVPASRRNRYVGIDNTAAGRTAGSLLGRFLPNRRGKVALIAGSLALRDHAERRSGFEQVLAQDFPSVEVIAVREGRDDPAKVKDVVAELMRENRMLAGIYNVGAGNRGVIEVLEASGRAGDIAYVAHELTDETRGALIRGTVDAVIGQDAGHEVRSAARILHAIANDWPILDDQERIRIDIFIRDNVR